MLPGGHTSTDAGEAAAVRGADARFALAVSLVLAHEGGAALTDDPADPGGLTKYGISQRAYPRLNIAALTEADARAIYRRDYWDACRCAELPWPLALYVFDAAVNQGRGAAVRMLQAALGVAADGVIGPATLAAARRAGRREAALFMAQRARRYMSTPGFGRFGAGWLTRTYLVTIEGGAGHAPPHA